MKHMLLGLFAAVALYAQVDTGGISGVVTDRSASTIPDAKVRITQPATNFSTEVKTNQSGFYSAPSLRPG